MSANSAPILNSAGNETIKANSNFRIPLAAYTSNKPDYLLIRLVIHQSLINRRSDVALIVVTQCANV